MSTSHHDADGTPDPQPRVEGRFWTGGPPITLREHLAWLRLRIEEVERSIPGHGDAKGICQQILATDLPNVVAILDAADWAYGPLGPCLAVKAFRSVLDLEVDDDPLGLDEDSDRAVMRRKRERQATRRREGISKALGWDKQDDESGLNPLSPFGI